MNSSDKPNASEPCAGSKESASNSAALRDTDTEREGAGNHSGENKRSVESSQSTEPDKPGFNPQQFLKTVTQRPGVYQMLNLQGDTIYVGKAGNLKKRVSSYFQKDPGSAKTRIMVAQIANVELTVTNNEIEALILENNLIKEKRPRYNILLRDDKSYPFVHITTAVSYTHLTLPTIYSV